MKLSEYLADNGITQTDFAKSIGVGHWTVGRYMTRIRLPRRDMMDKIARATGNQVLPNDFFDAEAAE